MKKLCLLLPTLAAGLALALTPGAAYAEGDGGQVGKNHKLILEALNGADNEPATDGSFIRWDTRGGDSPIDTNSRALHVRINSTTGTTYADAYSEAMLSIDAPVADVQNMSFDVRADGVGAGSPRISVVLTNGDVLFLTASTCENPIGVSGGEWVRADFTGAKEDCGFYDSNNDLWSADGTSSAMDVYAAANPDAFVSYAFLVLDEGPANVFLDRIAIGTDRLYNFSSNRAVRCQGDENRC